VLVSALACSIGLHWIVFQSLAWTTMLAGNLSRDSIAQAVTRTFDGKHPCPLCKAIAAGKKSEKKSEWTPSFKSFEFPPAPADFVLTAPASFPKAPSPRFIAECRPHSPP